jgi:twitching motility protein PilT
MGPDIIHLDESLAYLVRRGKTTMEIAKGFSEHPDEFESVVAGRLPDAAPKLLLEPSPDGLLMDLQSA